MFSAPAPPGEEEKWEEPKAEAQPKAEPPPPPVPTSPPPVEELGFAFGKTKTQTMGACTKRGTWSKRDGNYHCSKAPEGAQFPGKPVLSFCGDALCAIGLVVVVDGNDYASWNARFMEMKQALVDKHGPPTVDTQNVGAECQNEEFVKCLDEGKASAEATWSWKEGHRLSLTMSKKKSGEGPSAIRFVSIVGAPQ